MNTHEAKDLPGVVRILPARRVSPQFQGGNLLDARRSRRRECRPPSQTSPYRRAHDRRRSLPPAL